jgi:hypothetical protein
MNERLPLICVSYRLATGSIELGESGTTMQTTTSLRHRYPRARTAIRCSIGIGMLLMALCVHSANAGPITLYGYTGNDFTTAVAPFTTSDNIYGSFTVATLAPDLNAQTIIPTSYDFSDGVNQYTSTNGSTIDIFVNTSGDGEIAYWVITVENSARTWFASTGWYPYGLIMGWGQFEDYAMSTESGWSPDPWRGQCANCDYVQNAPGTWSSMSSNITTPEPATGVLTPIALLVLAFGARKRVAQGIRFSPQMPR